MASKNFSITLIFGSKFKIRGYLDRKNNDIFFTLSPKFSPRTLEPNVRVAFIFLLGISREKLTEFRFYHLSIIEVFTSGLFSFYWRYHYQEEVVKKSRKRFICMSDFSNRLGHSFWNSFHSDISKWVNFFCLIKCQDSPLKWFNLENIWTWYHFVCTLLKIILIYFNLL